MSSGLQIVATGDMYSIGPVSKARYTGYMGGTTPMGNAYSFSGTSFGWFFPWHVSLLAWPNVPLSTLLNARRCECLWYDLALLVFVGERFGELLEDNSSSVGVSASSRMMGSFPLSRVVGCLA